LHVKFSRNRRLALAPEKAPARTLGIAVMNERPVRPSTLLRAIAFGFGLSLGLIAARSASALGTPEQRRACTPDVYRLCAGEIPNVRAITACLRRQKANLSEACRAVFEQ
jgi:hypothetical protein